MNSQPTETSRIADQMRRTHGSRAHAQALQSLAHAAEERNPEKVALWKYVSLMLALRTPTSTI